MNINLFLQKIKTDKSLRIKLFNEVSFILIAMGITSGIIMLFTAQKLVGIILLLMALWILRIIWDKGDK